MDKLTQHIAARKSAGLDGGVWEAIDQRFLALGGALAAQNGEITEQRTNLNMLIGANRDWVSRLLSIEERQSARVEVDGVISEGKRPDPPSLIDVLTDIRDDIQTLCVLQQQANATKKRRRR